MKIHKKKKLKRRGDRGPQPTIGGDRMTLFPGDSLDRLPKLNDLYDEAKLKRITKARALREGAKIWISKRIKEVKAALTGDLHNKRRK